MGIEPAYQNDDVTLYHGDALSVVPTLEGVSAVVTDPPYGIAHATNRDNRDGTASASWKGTQIHGDDDAALRDWIVGWAEERGLPWAAFGSWKVPRPAKCRGVLIWDKGPASGMGDLSFPWKMSWEEIYVGGPGWAGARDEGVLQGHRVLTWESKGRRHPHAKPITLIRDIVAKLPADAVVLDPFAGSGTTGVAAMKTGRRCILIEKDERYIPTIISRLKAAEMPLLAGLKSD